LDRKRGKRPNQLERAADAAAANLVRPKPLDVFLVEDDRAVIGRDGAGHDVEQRGLASAVWTDDRKNRSARYAKAHIVEGQQAAKALADALHVEEHAHDRQPVTPSLAASHGHTPFGSISTTTSRQIP